MKFTKITNLYVCSKWSIPILILSVFSLLSLAVYLKYEDGWSCVRTHIDPVFQYAVDEELDFRFNNSEIAFIYPFSATGEKQINKGAHRIYGYPENQQKQWLLYKNGYTLNPDSLFCKVKALFKAHGMSADCVVCYVNLKTNEVVKSRSLSSSSDMPFHSELLMLDAMHTIQVQCFVDFSFFTILNEGHWNIYFLLAIVTGGILLLLIGLTINRRRNKWMQEMEKAEPSEKKPEETPWIIGFENIFLDTKQGKLSNGIEIISLTPYTEQLMKLFLDAPDRFLSNEEIMQTLWGTVGTKNKLNNLVSQLRKILNTLNPSIKIENTTGRGYQLVNNSAKKEE